MIIRWIWSFIILISVLVDASPVRDIDPTHEGNFQNDDDVCPDYKTCSSNGLKYWNTLLNTLSQAQPVDRTDGLAKFQQYYDAEMLLSEDRGSSLRQTLTDHGLDLAKMILWATYSKNPTTGAGSDQTAYSNFFDTANGVLIAIENWRIDDEQKQLPWSELMYQTWQLSIDEQNKNSEETYQTGWSPGKSIAALQYSIQSDIHNEATQAVMRLAYETMGYPNPNEGDNTWRKWTQDDPTTKNWFYALLGSDNCKGTIWLLNDHAAEIGKKEITEIWTRWPKVYPDIW